MPIKYACVCCKKPVKCNQRALLCTNCKIWAHITCARVPQSQYNDRKEHFENWSCPTCILQELPFFNEELDLDRELCAGNESNLERDTNLMKNVIIYMGPF